MKLRILTCIVALGPLFTLAAHCTAQAQADHRDSSRNSFKFEGRGSSTLKLVDQERVVLGISKAKVCLAGSTSRLFSMLLFTHDSAS